MSEIAIEYFKNGIKHVYFLLLSFEHGKTASLQDMCHWNDSCVSETFMQLLRGA